MSKLHVIKLCTDLSFFNHNSIELLKVHKDQGLMNSAPKTETHRTLYEVAVTGTSLFSVWLGACSDVLVVSLLSSFSFFSSVFASCVVVVCSVDWFSPSCTFSWFSDFG